MNVTYLECSLTGERYEAGEIHNLSRSGKPLLVRYDLEAAKKTLTRESLAERESGMWKWRELWPNQDPPVSLAEPGNPVIHLLHIPTPDSPATLPANVALTRHTA